jgi:hypothetical protein
MATQPASTKRPLITITGANDGPEVEGEITSEPVTEEDASFTIDLLTGASDPDGTDSISVDEASMCKSLATLLASA